MQIKTYVMAILLLVQLFLSSIVYADEQSPWRLNNAIPMPEWFSISGQFRTRFENLDEQFRGTRNGGDQALLLRTLIHARVKAPWFTVGAEMQDSRAYEADRGTPLSTSDVNPLELLQAYIEIPFNDFIVTGSKSQLRGGRITMDVGSRRLVARNRFRNTINAFTGIDWNWTSAAGNNFRTFYTLPVQRRVSGNILDNDARFDREHDDVRFWGLYFAPATLPWNGKGEVYLFGLNEDDADEWATRDRDLYTTGFRLYQQPAKNAFGYEVESVFQFGESRSSTSSTDTTDLDHFAHFQHAELSYQFDRAWSPTLVLQYDFASGDENPLDNDNDRFDTLFGARRFDFGPTSIYGPFARSNLSSPGIRVKMSPAVNITSFISLRGFWLASDNDIWTTAGYGNTPGSDDNYIGTQIEGRLRWNIMPDNILFEAGAAHIFAGDIMDNAGKDDTSYFYTQLVFNF